MLHDATVTFGVVLLVTMSPVSRRDTQWMQALRAALIHASSSQCPCCHYVRRRASIIAFVTAVRKANLDRSVLRGI